MTIPTTNVTMSSINRALNRTNTAQINFSTQVYSVNSAYTMGSTRGRVKDYYCLLKADSEFTDYTNTFNYNGGNATVSTNTSKFGGASFYFPDLFPGGPTLSYSIGNMPINKNFNSYSGDWTIEGWVYLEGGDSVKRFVTSWGHTIDSSIRVDANGYLHAYYFDTDGSFRSIWAYNSGTFPYYQWIHFAAVKQGGFFRLYQNGLHAGAVSVNGDGLQMNSFYLGNSNPERFQGYLDEIRFSAYARYPDGTNFTPPTSSFAA
jgi:hypothetical protein